jgi:hypothetical protein
MEPVLRPRVPIEQGGYGPAKGVCREGVTLTMDTTDTIRRIEKELGMSQTYRVSTFEGIRENADGSWQEITLEVLDGGEDAEDRRYVAVLDIEDGERTIESRTAPTVDEALSDVGSQLG